MSKSVNQVTLLGNITKDLELKYTPQGTAVVNFSIATNRSYKDKTTDEWKDIAEFTNVVFWGKSAEVISQYCKKGNKLFVQGRLQTRSWDDKETGKKRYLTEVFGNEFTLLTPKPQQVEATKPQATSEQAEEIFDPQPEQQEMVVEPLEAKDTTGGEIEGFEEWMDEEEKEGAT